MMIICALLTVCLTAVLIGRSVATDLKENVCPVGKPQVHCKADPCNVSTGCKGYPGAECRANYCGGCNAEYFVEGQKVNCSVCPGGKPVLTCDSACRYARPAHGYFCLPDFCGDTCTMKFVKLCPDGSRPVTCMYPACARTLCAPHHTCVSTYCGGCNAECVPNTIG